MGALEGRRTADRVTIQADTLKLLEPLTRQLKDEFQGLLKINREVVINLILSMRSEAFSSREIEKIRREKLTKKEQAKWLLKQVELAEKSGKDISLESLLKQIQSPGRAPRKNLKNSSSPSKQGDSQGSGSTEI